MYNDTPETTNLVDDTDINRPSADSRKVKGTVAYIQRATKSASLSGSDKLGFFVVASFCLLGFLSLLSLINLWLYWTLANKPAPALVQTSDGKSIRVLAMSGDQRSPQVVKDSATLALAKIFTWRNFLTPTNADEFAKPKIDPGIEVPGAAGKAGGKVPTGAWEGTFALSADLQGSFLRELAAQVTEAGIFGGAQVTIEVLKVYEPISTGAGQWRVAVVANLVRIDPSTRGLPTRAVFNKDIYLRAVPVPVVLDQGNMAQNQLSRILADQKAAGLEIFAIRDSSRPDLSPGGQPSSTGTAPPSASPSAVSTPITQ